MDGPCGWGAGGEEREPVDEIEEEACDDGADDWVEHFAEGTVGGGLHEPDAGGPEDEFDAETVDEEDAHPVAAWEEDGHDGDGEVAVVLDGAGEGEGAAGGGFAEAEDGGGGVGEEPAEEHEEDAADEGDPDIFGAAEGGITDDVLEDEAGVGDVDGEADHGGVTCGSEDAETAEGGPGSHEEEDGEGCGEQEERGDFGRHEVSRRRGGAEEVGPLGAPCGREAERFGFGHFDESEGLTAGDEEGAVGWSGDFEAAPEAGAFEGIEPAADGEEIAEESGAAVVDFGADDDGEVL